MADLADRAEVMDAVIDWFGGCEELGADQPCILLVDDDQSSDFRIYLPLILK